MKFNVNATVPQFQYHQLKTKYRAFIGGFGTGKTQTLVDAACMDALKSSKALIGIYEPTNDLLRVIIAPRLLLKLDQSGIRYNYNKQANTITTSNSGVGDFLLRSLDTPERIVGYETYASHIDELDTLNAEHAEHAFRQIDARNRQNLNLPNSENRIGVYTTPEGFKFVYKRWVAEPTAEFGMVQASSRSNPYLKDGYVDSLMANYPESLRAAYIEGQFVNLTSGSVYGSYDITANDCTTALFDDEIEILVGLDFNVGNMSAVIAVWRGSELHVIDEIVGAYDTPDMIFKIQQKYAKPGRVIKIYPDAAGNQRHSNNGCITDHIQLQQAGFRIYVDGQNPRVRDRINTVNAAFCNGKGVRRLKINKSKCPTIRNNVLQQAYTKNGEPDKSNGNDHTNDALGYLVWQLIGFTASNVTKIIKFT